MATTNEDILVYVPDIPSNIPEKDAEQMLQNRVETIGRMKISRVKYYSKLGVAVIQLMNEDDKIYLVDNVQSTVLDTQRRINISFVNELELDSYIVLARNTSKIPSSEQVIARFKQVYKETENPICEPISDQFPNIFHIVLNSLDDLAKVANAPDFQIDGILATVYPRAEHSFFEDLPPFIANAKLLSAVTAEIGGKELPATSLYVQYNKDTSNAVVLVTKCAKTWATEIVLTIDGRKVQQKKTLAARVLVSPIPHGFDVNRIIDDNLFRNRVIAHNHINDQLILELDSMDSYKYCLNKEFVKIDGTTMEIKPYALVIDPETMDIHAGNWYETAMLEIKPDIMTLIPNPQHPIFHYQWNAQNWIEQFRKIDSTEQRSKDSDLYRHLLRVTVMLNTIGVLRKQHYTVNNVEVVLKPGRMQTIVYDHKSKLSHGTMKNSMSNIKTRYPSTSVKVVNEDCLIVYQKLVSEGHRPLLLNMANQTHPGGGYRKGDGAQEEDLFRRSNYYQSLDTEIADKNQSERFHSNDKGELKPISNIDTFYPMDDFGAIYTSDITVFRQTEANGYAYMKNPLYNVCAIAMAACKDPKLKNNKTLENKFAVKTQKKIENIFAIAYHHKHDCLVLSAFGCGAYKNPPEHIASIFESVILQYAGFFNTIYFAIVDDDNSSHQKNFLPFKELFDSLIVSSPTILRINAAIGPNRILDKSADGQLTLSNISILDLPPCHHGAKCRDYRKPAHKAQFSHPPMCPLSNLTSSCDRLDDENHTFTFIHNAKCKFGGECTDNDPIHLLDFDHPEFCRYGGDCTNISQKHLVAYQHLPNCSDGPKCSKYRRRDPDHLKSFRHCKSVCPNDNSCPYFHDKKHFDSTIHSFRQPCRLTPYICPHYIEFVQSNNAKGIVPLEVENHCLEYSHLCPFGRRCRTTDENHLEISIHIARQLCSDGTNCSKLTQEEHLESYTHPDIRDIRLLCKHPGYKCSERFNSDHFKRYRHNNNFDHFSVAPSSNLNASINFASNQSQLTTTVNTYMERMNWKKTVISPDIINWIRALQPVHRCRQEIFESILVLGHVMSRRFMNLLRKPENVVRAVQQHGQVRSILLRHNTPVVKENVCKLIEILVEREFEKAKSNDKTISLDSDYEQKLYRIEKRLQPPLSNRDIQIIHEQSTRIAQSSIKLNMTPMGIGYSVDEQLGTDQHVFSILGPHLGHYYGDIVITFKREIMFHPDANFSIQAGTTFYSGLTYKLRPWLKDPTTAEKRIQNFHSSKLHCSFHRYEYAAAAELVALTGLDQQSMNVDLKAILEHWIDVDSHFTFEGHLPQLIPLDYIDRVYIPKNVFESLSFDAQTLARDAFKDSLIISIYESDDHMIESDITQKEILDRTYPKYVFEQLCEAIKHRMNLSTISRGIVVTVAASEFEEHIIIPITISQAYHLYHHDKPQSQSGHEVTYIYWQAMNGDMMLTVANDKINPGDGQFNLQCLICYIAAKPLTTTGGYRETYSYLNDGLPYQHGNNVTAGHFKAKSNTFYRGCNTDDYFTFCLKISHATGEVKLSHAGPNSIYNHEKIEYQFNRANMDLSKLDFIHLSAGSHDVPVRNLTINFEPIPELHPSVDMNFKKDTSNLLEKHLVPISYIDPNDSIAQRTTRGKPVRIIPPSDHSNMTVLGRIGDILCCRNTNVVVPVELDDAPPKLKPCEDSIYCLLQNSSKHTREYSHPCGFSEICPRKAKEPHLTHERHNALKCVYDRNCDKKTDPVHRAEFRHTNLPDYLIPCRKQMNCVNQSPKHRIIYFHGETLPLIRRK